MERIPTLNPNETRTFQSQLFNLGESGVAWINVELKANDGGEVHLYSADFDMGNTWKGFIRIKNLETERLIALVEKIAQLLERGKAE